MRIRTLSVVFALLASVMLAAGSFWFVGTEPAVAQQTDEEVPAGNPVIGSDRPGDIEPENDTRYLLWGLVAVCLIGAGFLLVRIERWERRRSDQSIDGSTR